METYNHVVNYSYVQKTQHARKYGVLTYEKQCQIYICYWTNLDL